MAPLRNPAPAKPWYEHDARPGSPGTQAAQPRNAAIGAHPDKNPGIVRPDNKSPERHMLNSQPIGYGAGSEGQGRAQAAGTRGTGLGKQHGPQSGGNAELEVDPARPYGTANRHAGRGNPSSPG